MVELGLKSICAAPKSKIVCLTCPLPLLTVLCPPVFQTPFVMHHTCLLSPFRGLPLRMHAHNFVHVEILRFSQDSLSPEPVPGCPPWNSHGILYRGTWERELFRITLYLPLCSRTSHLICSKFLWEQWLIMLQPRAHLLSLAYRFWGKNKSMDTTIITSHCSK